jgi:hypothetical protein
MAMNNVFTGSHGTLGVAVEGTPTQQADFNAINDAYGATIIGRVTDVEVCVRTELLEFYEIGLRDVVTLSTGKVHVSGTLGRAYVNGALAFLLLGRGAKENGVTTIQPRFVLNLSLQNPHLPDDAAKVNVFGVKFETWGLHIPQEDFVMEQVRFKAAGLGLLDRDEGNDIAVAFPEATA